jgi:hypothetical protein
MILLQTVVFPDAVPPATPITNACSRRRVRLLPLTGDPPPVLMLSPLAARSNVGALRLSEGGGEAPPTPRSASPAPAAPAACAPAALAAPGTGEGTDVASCTGVEHCCIL